MNPVSVKVVSVGDDGVGKTCMLIAYTQRTFPTDYIPTVFDEYAATINIGGNFYQIQLWDSAGSDQYDRLRPLSYPSTNIFILFFSVLSQASFDRITSKWIPEISQHNNGAPFILVGTKTDLRDDEAAVEQMRQADGRGPITSEEGADLARVIGAQGYFEISSLRLEGVDALAERAILLGSGAVAPNARPANKLSKCSVL